MKAKPDIFEAQAELCRIFTHPLRIRLLHLLARRERSVNSLVHQTGLSQPTLSQHLAVLRDSGVVRTRRTGTTIHYRLGDTRLLEACRIMRSVTVDIMADETQDGAS